MKLFGYELLIVKQGRYIVVDVKKRIRDIYIKGGKPLCIQGDYRGNSTRELESSSSRG